MFAGPAVMISKIIILKLIHSGIVYSSTQGQFHCKGFSCEHIKLSSIYGYHAVTDICQLYHVTVVIL